MRHLPNGIDWFVVGPSEAGGQIHVTTVGGGHLDEQYAFISGAIESLGDAGEIPAMCQLVLMPISIGRVLISAVKIEGRGAYRSTTVAATRDHVDADRQPASMPESYRT